MNNNLSWSFDKKIFYNKSLNIKKQLICFSKIVIWSDLIYSGLTI